MIGTTLVQRIQGIVKLGLCSMVLSTAAQAAQVNLYFWPGPITQEDPTSSGSLYAWPSYEVLLQNKSTQGVYSPAIISDSMATELALRFKADAGSPIKIMRDGSTKTWGLSIPGGSELAASNQTLLEPMLQGFANCLASLTSDELDRMKEVIYAPLTFLDSSSGTVRFDEEQRRIAAKMYETYKNKRCEGGTTVVPELTKKTSRRYFNTLLTGLNPDASVTDGSLLVLTNLYKDLLFASKGLWIRVTLAELQTFIGDVLARFPSLANTDWLDKDYSSFVDFVLLTRDKSGLSKDQYLKLANACGVDAVSQIFSSFPLKQCSNQNRLQVVHLFLNTSEAVLFLGGGPS